MDKGVKYELSMTTIVKRNDGFVCKFCGQKVPPSKSSCRDHCNKCLWSLHVDISPGDRQNPCQGNLRPAGLDFKEGKQRVVYKCESCGQKLFCVIADDDSREALLQISTNVWV